MALRIFNSLTGKKDDFAPMSPGEARMYVCGVTVYDFSHIGHARSALVFDVIRRYLAFKGLRVRFVRNFTDVDDKIIRRAYAEGVAAREISERYIAEFRTDMAAVGVLPGDVEPKATEHIPQMIRLIEQLIAKGIAYAVDGDVYYEVRRFPPYGRLSGKNLEELQAGARVEVDERKKDPLDFALWKATKPGEPSWESPWGPGRPGWHIECSAMSMQYLGETFDIHGGGEDLIFPHHENEIAQSEGATGRPFVRHWIHNGFVNIGAEKMSKSLGNTLLIRALLERHHPDSLRRYLLGTHYRNPLDFFEPRIHESRLAIGRLRNTITNTSARAGRSLLPPEGEENTESSVRAAVAAIDDDRLRDRVAACVDGFVAGMDDDFNTPRALASLADLGSEIVRHDGTADGGQPASAVTRSVQVLWQLGRALGFFYRQLDPVESTVERPEVQALLGEREAARRRRDWKRADEIRDQIEGMGLKIEDTPTGARVVQEH